jgi:hypothetical protein
VVKTSIGLRLRDKLGPDASLDLSQAIEEAQNNMMTMTAERFDARLAAVASELRQEMNRMDSGLRVTLAEGLAKIRIDLSESRVEMVRWSFFFWIGQFTATLTVIGLLWGLAKR